MGVGNAAKKALRALFETGQSLSLDILPRHFYSEIPDIRALKKDPSWKRPFSMAGVRGVELKDQLAFLHDCFPPETIEAVGAGGVHEGACRENGHDGYGAVEADVLYAFIRKHRPATIFQIGCGVSTAVILKAAADASYRPELHCVEPFPNEFLIREHGRGNLKLIRLPAQTLSPVVIESLPPGTFFFVDSSHTLGPGGEVTRIMLEYLPRLKAGCYVHFHDIYFPYDYDRHVLKESLFFTHESALLHAFLAFSDRFRLLGALSMIHYAAPAELKALVPRYQPAPNDEGLAAGAGHFPSAAYLSVE